MGVLKEFKEFAMRGNVVDMAVGIFLGEIDFSQLAIALKEKTVLADAVTIKYGKLIVLTRFPHFGDE